jgi:hypothetical protein
MAGGLAVIGTREVLDFVLRGVLPTIPGTVYMRLLETPSTITTSGTETSYGAYTRLPMVRNTSLFTDPGLTSRSTNVGSLVFGTPTSADNDLIAWDWVNTASGAFTETYLRGVIQPARSVVVGKPIRFPAGSLLVTAA